MRAFPSILGVVIAVLSTGMPLHAQNDIELPSRGRLRVTRLGPFYRVVYGSGSRFERRMDTRDNRIASRIALQPGRVDLIGNLGGQLIGALPDLLPILLTDPVQSNVLVDTNILESQLMRQAALDSLLSRSAISTQAYSTVSQTACSPAFALSADLASTQMDPCCVTNGVGIDKSGINSLPPSTAVPPPSGVLPSGPIGSTLAAPVLAPVTTKVTPSIMEGSIDSNQSEMARLIGSIEGLKASIDSLTEKVESQESKFENAISELQRDVALLKKANAQ